MKTNTDYINVLAFLLVGNVGGVINEVGDTLPLPDSFTWILKLDGTHGVILSRTLFFTRISRCYAPEILGPAGSWVLVICN